MTLKFRLIRVYNSDLCLLRKEIKKIFTDRYPEIPDTYWTDAQLFKRIVEFALK